MKKKPADLRAIDFFCGAGGFSEGFRQQGFKIIQGIDYWKPAVDTHNLNHGLKDETKSVLDFWSEDSGDVQEINQLDDTECIIGSPPCVSFSSSNRSGKANKDKGIKLIEAFLRVIAVKKHKPGSKLLVWYMENVPNSRKFVSPEYTFEMLNLGKWAKVNGKNPSDVALKVKNNGDILDSGDYGAPQSRKRFIAGEWCATGEFLSPTKTHSKHITLGDIRDKLPAPNLSKKKVFASEYTDPNYPSLKVKGPELTDQFYDTGLYHIESEEAQYLKQNHSYMGVMSFPENKNNPCRTIMATRSAKTREALIYPSEYKRRGDGEYRLPTIREIASLMGFPIVYQFTGSEGTKWRQIGNAVSPHLSSALAKAVRIKLGITEVEPPDFSTLVPLRSKVQNLNTFTERIFDRPKKRKKDARFRRHSFKSGNMTVELMNYTELSDVPGEKWHIEAFFGTGVGFEHLIIGKKQADKIEEFLLKELKGKFSSFAMELNGYLKSLKGLNVKDFQRCYEADLSLQNKVNPMIIVKKIGEIVQKKKEKDDFISGLTIIPKETIPVSQLYLIYGLYRLISINDKYGAR